MSYYEDLAASAYGSYFGGRSYEAALQFRHAAKAAREGQNLPAWYECTARAAESYINAGDLRSALALLIDARADEPDGAPAFSRWLARILLFRVTLISRPYRDSLENQLYELKGYAIQHACSQADVAFMEGDLHYYRGNWEESLSSYEAAWEAHNESGFIKSLIAYDAVEVCLRLNRLAAAQSWIQSTSGLDDEFEQSARRRVTYNCILELATPIQTSSRRAAALRLLQDRCPVDDGAWYANKLRELIVRTRLLCATEGDPVARLHPSRNELRRRWREKHSVHTRYSARLLLLDYRLACLRYGANISPVEDFYYSQPQSVPPRIIETPDLRLRLRKAQAALNWALVYAKHLDAMLECDFRLREVESRGDRLAEITRSIISVGS
jgi:hypothetical protein